MELRINMLAEIRSTRERATWAATNKSWSRRLRAGEVLVRTVEASAERELSIAG